LKEKGYSVFHRPSYAIPPALYHDHLGVKNNRVLLLNKNTFQFTSDRVEITMPAVTPDYEDKITNLYMDIDGHICPLYDNHNHLSPIIQRIKQFDKTRVLDVDTSKSILMLPSLTEGIHHVKLKVLTKDGSYYLIDTGIVFESK
jgi:hypothetical protein